MPTFIDADFRNDPRIAPVIVLHLLENRVGRQDVEQLKVKLQAQNTLITTQWRDIDRLISSVNDLKRKGQGNGRQGSGSMTIQETGNTPAHSEPQRRVLVFWLGSLGFLRCPFWQRPWLLCAQLPQ